MGHSITRRRGVTVGTGYFSQFHYDAWQRLQDVSITALCTLDSEQGRAAAAKFGIPKVYTDIDTMLNAEKPDFIDIITPPDSHGRIIKLAMERGINVLCQKPLAPTFEDAVEIVRIVEASGARLMVHDNFRFQPWHREIRRLIQAGTIGALQSIGCRTRMGDGWGPDAYLARQPYFRTMPKLLIYETGVHFIDVFRYLGGEIDRVYAQLKRLNDVIAGEDRALVLCDFANGATGLWDADRYHQSRSADPRYTFGDFTIEGNKGTIRLDEDGRISIQLLGAPEAEHRYHHSRIGFAGDCVLATMRHFIDGLIDGAPFETEGRDYLNTLAVVEAVYASDRARQPVMLRLDR
jgi:predicted dehydrogenase